MNKINEIGNTYGRLTVIEEAKGDKSGVHWLCQCDCGEETIVWGVHLRSGNNKSCGCLARLAPGEASANRVLGHYKYEATRRKLVWGLSKEKFLRITQQDCFYCGEPPSRTASYHNATGGFKYNGLDRLDNEEGYSVVNVVACCSWCNWAKKERSPEEFMEWIERVYEHRLR